MAEIKFRTNDLEREELRKRKMDRTDYILEAAGITKDNSDYNRWYLATLVNVHNAYRFSYNGETEADLERVFEGFVSAIKENPIDKYEAATKEFLYERVVLQLDKAQGDYAHTATYEEMRETLNKTMLSGIKIRERNKTAFPKEFYKENGSTQRLIYEIPLEEQEESAMRNIDMIVAKYKDKGIEFSAEKNKFIVKGNEIGPEKFFTSKKDRLNKFFSLEQNRKTFDASDQKLFDVIQSGDFEKFAELRKQRGTNRDKMNENLRNALADEIVFHEISECWNTKESQTPETLFETIRETSEKFSKSGELVRKESEKDVLGRIDTVMFSILPEDLATQSTFRNWKSCMHATGCNHYYVDDSIGEGSIIAYGYDSREPYKMVSRLLIHPYQDNVSGEIAYKVNDRIYGRNNIGFRKAVEKVTEHFNEGKAGIYHFPFGLYDDNRSNDSFVLFPEKDGVVDLTNFRKDEDNVISLSGLDFSKVKEIKVPEGVLMEFKACIFEGDLSKCEGASFENCSFKNAVLPENAKLEGRVSLENTLIPETVDFKECVFNNCIFEGDLSKYEGASFEDCFFKNAILPKNATLRGSVSLENTLLPETVDFEECIFKDCICEGDLSKYKGASFEYCSFKNAVLPENATLKGRASFENTQFPKTVNFQVHHAEFIKNYVDTKGTKLEEVTTTLKDIEIPDGADLSSIKDLTIRGPFKIGRGVKLPEKVVFSQAIIDQDLSEYQQTKMELKSCVYNENCKLPHTGNATIKYGAITTHENAFKEIIDIPVDGEDSTIGIPKTVPLTVPTVQKLLDTYSGIIALNEELVEKAKTQELEDDDVSGVVYCVAKDEKTKEEFLEMAPAAKIMTKEEFIRSAKTNIQDKSDTPSKLIKTIQSNQVLTDKEQLALQRVRKNPGME